METTLQKIDQSEKQVKFLQYINTAILTFIGTVAMIMFLTMADIKKSQIQGAAMHEEFGKELLRLKTVQDINVASVKDLNQRVTTLEMNYLDYVKNWVDQNYVRKPQK
jgi:hypothetical protein